MLLKLTGSRWNMTVLEETRPLRGQQLNLFDDQTNKALQIGAGHMGAVRPGAPNILVGTCAWADHADFYPARLKPTERLPYYAQYFPIVEIDSTFYHIQNERNFRAWAERTPDYFKFNVKAFKALTLHERQDPFQTVDAARSHPGKPTRAVIVPQADTFEYFGASLQPLREAGKLRAIHFQFPPWFTATAENREYLETVRAFFPGDLLAVEFRHRSWLDIPNRETTMQTLRTLRMSYVIVDEPQIGTGSVPPVIEITNPELALFRFHGRNLATWYKPAATTAERFDYVYSEQELAGWQPQIEAVARQVRETHVLLNNCAGNAAVINGQQLRGLLNV